MGYNQEMMPRRAFRFWIVCSAIAVLIGSQMVLAGYECQRMNGISNIGKMPSDCMTEQAAPTVACSAHCEKEAQIGSGSTNFPAPVFSLVAWMQPLPALMSVITTSNTIYASALDPPLISPATPLRIQYQVFRI